MFTKKDNYARLVPITKAEFDEKMAEGWRLLGRYWYQHSDGSIKNALSVPTRIRLSDYKPKKNDRRTMRINEDLVLRITEATVIYRDYLDLFQSQIHKYYPDEDPNQRSLFNYVPLEYNLGDVKTMVLEVFHDGKFIAASFFQMGERWLSSNYCVYDREFNESTKRGLGIFTMLVEIEYAKQQGFEFYTSGYTDTVKSSFSYKADFVGLEYFNWEGAWKKYEGKFELDFDENENDENENDTALNDENQNYEDDDDETLNDETPYNGEGF